MQPVPQAPMQAQGLVNSQVSQQVGAFTTSIPIEVPAFHGVTPRLSIQYSSSGRNNSQLGVGFELSGIPVIERDSSKGDVRYLLDGEPLISSNATGGSHSTLRQSFDQITNNGSQWSVNRPDGTRLTFGHAFTTTSGTHRWGLTQVRDRNGNLASYNWSCDEGSNAAQTAWMQYDCYPSSISYGGISITIYRQSRPDEFTFATSGTDVGRTRYRITAVDVMADGSRVRAYGIKYKQSARTGRSLVESVQLFGGGAYVGSTGEVSGGTSLPKTDFTWSDAPQGFDSPVALVQDSALTGATGVTSHVFTGDFNGDGREDLLIRKYSANNTVVNAYIKLANSTGGFSSPIDISSKAGTQSLDGGPGWRYAIIHTGDFNGDGRTDVLLRVPYASLQTWPVRYSARLLIANAGGGFDNYTDATNLTNIGPEFWASRRVLTGDFNGDGKTDLLFPDLDSSQKQQTTDPVYWSALALADGSSSYGSGFSEATTLTEFTGMKQSDWKPSELTIADLNGDGLSDVIAQVPETYSVVNGNTTVYPNRAVVMMAKVGYSFFSTVKDITNSFGLSKQVWNCANLVPGDFNGDGKIDLLAQRRIGCVDSPKPGHYLLFGSASLGATGGFGDVAFVRAINVTTLYGMTDQRWGDSSLITGDFNGDSRTDLLVKGAHAAPSYLLSANGIGFEPALDISNRFGMTQNTWGFASRFGDFDGDGDDDILLHIDDDDSSVMAPAMLRASDTQANVITAVSNGLGATTSVTYVPSVNWPDNDSPVRAPTVQAITIADGRGGSTTTQYQYSGNAWDRLERRHLGFEWVKAIGPAGDIEETYFYQGPEFRAGEMEEYYLKNSSGGLMAARSRVLSGSSSAPWVRNLVHEDNDECNGDSVCKTTRTTYTHDRYGNVKSMAELGDTTVSGDERYSSYSYASGSPYLENLLSEKKVYAGNSANGQLLQHERYYYNDNLLGAAASGDLTKTEAWLDNTGAFVVTTATYDNYGNQTSVTDANNNTSSTEWATPYGRFPSLTRNALNQETKLTWDLVCGVQLTSTDPNQAVTSWVSDKLCRKQVENRPDGGKTVWSYDSFGTSSQRVTETVYSSSTAFTSRASYFDGLGRETRSISNGTDYVDSTYDSRGLLATISAPRLTSEPAKLTRFQYDALRRLTLKTFPDTSTQKFHHGDGFTTTCDELGNPRTQYRDAYGQVVKVREYLGKACSLQPAATVGVDAFDTVIRYDLLGRRTGHTNAAGHVSTSAFDSLGRLKSKSDPDLGTWSYTYDLGGRLQTQTDAKGQTLKFEYDKLNRVTYKLTASGQELAWYRYDEAGHGFGIGGRTSMTDGSGATRFEYDTMGRVTKEERTTFPEQLGADCITTTILRSYDWTGKVKTLTYPTGEVLTHGYDTVGRLVSLTSSTRGALVTTASYDARGSLMARTLGNGVIETLDYDPNRFWFTGTAAERAGTTLQDIVFVRNLRGEVKTRSNLLQSSDNWSYVYDDLRRLKTATNTGNAAWNESFSYDAIGRLTHSSTLGSYSYASSGAPAHAPQQIGAGGLFSYDNNGNLLSGNSMNLAYNVENKPVLVNGLSMAYDGDGVRTRLGGIEFHGDIYEYERSNGKKTSHYYFNGQRLARSEGMGTVYYHGDHLNSAATLTDTNGNLLSRQVLSPYGRRLSGLNDPIGLAGQRLDATGLYHMGAREMSGVLGLFVTPDPSGAPDPTRPQTLNRFAYANNNPTNLIDPTGFSAQEPCGEGGCQMSATPPNFFRDRFVGRAIGHAIGDPIALFRADHINPLTSQVANAGELQEAKLGLGMNIATITLMPVAVAEGAFAKATMTVFRVESPGNARLIIGAEGSVSTQGGNTLFLNFGQEARAIAFRDRRIAQGFEGTVIKSFEVPTRHLEKLRASSVLESEAVHFPGAPLRVDLKTADQFGLRSKQIEELQQAIIPGSGKVQ